MKKTLNLKLSAEYPNDIHELENLKDTTKPFVFIHDSQRNFNNFWLDNELSLDINYLKKFLSDHEIEVLNKYDILKYSLYLDNYEDSIYLYIGEEYNIMEDININDFIENEVKYYFKSTTVSSYEIQLIKDIFKKIDDNIFIYKINARWCSQGDNTTFYLACYLSDKEYFEFFKWLKSFYTRLDFFMFWEIESVKIDDSNKKWINIENVDWYSFYHDDLHFNELEKNDLIQEFLEYNNLKESDFDQINFNHDNIIYL